MRELIKSHKEREEAAFKATGKRVVYLTRDEIKEIRQAEVVVSTAIHPDTNEFIPWVCRLSSFLPCNVPIAFGFIIAKPTPFNTIFWQWINQTYNALMNYGNRNATSLYTTEDILKSYAAAVTSSIGVALGIRKALSGYTRNLTGARLIIANAISSFFACSIAGYLNAKFMRKTELERGIDITDQDGNIIGKSKAAAHKAVNQTANSRFFLAIPIFIPPFILFGIERARMMPKNFYLRTTLEILCICFELYFAVPFAIGAYP